MLNINKIESDINFNNLNVTDVSKILGGKYTTIVHRMKSGNWTPNDVEKLADYFHRPLAYYFDRDEADKPMPPYNKPCTDQECLAEMAKLKLEIETLKYDKRILNGVLEKMLQGGGPEIKSDEGGVETHRKTG
jgi:hypothetical protein